jgi:hypothetical protein
MNPDRMIELERLLKHRAVLETEAQRPDCIGRDAVAVRKAIEDSTDKIVEWLRLGLEC